MNAKLALSILMAVFVLAACDSAADSNAEPNPGEEQQELEPGDGEPSSPTIGDAYQSDCLGDLATALTAEDDAYSLVVDDDGVLTIVDSGAVFNCCLSAWMEVAIDGDVITVVEREDPDKTGACRCMCPYELSITVADLPAGTYEVEIYLEGAEPHLAHAESVEIP